jgi:carboxypeptidase C (cathepsin A)
MRRTVLAGLAVLVWSAGAVARQQPAGGGQPTNVAVQVAVPSAPPEPRRFVTRRTGRFNGREVRYTATAGETFLRDAKGAPQASVFSFAYTEDSPADAVRRPVTFVWNGGPGSSSIWLHFGGFGPVRVVVPSDARSAGSPPYRTEPNTETVLDVTDLVFVDPIGTGFSRALGEHKDEESWGLDQDAASVAAFIREWLTEHRRWNSPRFLMGESFGTTRAAAVADRLQQDGVDVNGLVLISQALDYQGSTPEAENFASYVTYLPTMAATAWYHKRVTNPPARLEDFLAASRRFAIDEYAPALLRGTGLDPSARAAAVKRLAYFTGLDEKYVDRADLRVLGGRFLKELLRDKGLALGRSDSRYTVDDVDDVADRAEIDAASAAIGSAFTATLLQYLATDLGVSVPSTYKTASQEAGEKWKWRTVPEGRPYEPSYVNVGPRLGVAMRRNPSLRVLVASGYYDFATPFFDAELTFARYGIVRDRVRMTYYEAGHMMYVHEPSRQRLLADVRTFLTGR